MTRIYLDGSAHKCNFQNKYFARTRLASSAAAATPTHQQEQPFHYFNYRSQKTIVLSLVWQQLVYDCISKSFPTIVVVVFSTTCIEIVFACGRIRCASLLNFTIITTLSSLVSENRSPFVRSIQTFCFADGDTVDGRLFHLR